MTCEEVVNYLKSKNNYVEKSLVDGFVTQKIIENVPMYVIEYCAINPDAQKALIEMSFEELKVLSKIISYAQSMGQDWISLGAKFKHLLENERYSSLISSVREYGLEDELIPNFLFLTNNSGNFFQINSIEDVRNIRQTRMNKLEKFNETNDPNVILLIKYGISYDEAYNYYKRYAKDVDKLPDSETKSFLIDIKSLIEGKGTTERLFTNLYFTNFIDSRLRNMFVKIYNERLYQISPESFVGSIEIAGASIPVYDAGTDFTMCIYSYGLASDLESPENYKTDWARPEVAVDYMCNSIINSFNMRTSIKHCVFGFNNFAENDIALLAANDLGTGGIYNDVNITNPYYNNKLIADVEFRVPDELINNTRFTNNEVYRARRRVVDGELQKVMPDYIVYFKNIHDVQNDRIWHESIKAAKDFQIPIVVVDCEKCLSTNVGKIDAMLESFETRYDDVESIRKIIENTYSIRSGYHIAPQLLEQYLGNEKVYSYAFRMTEHIKTMSTYAPTIATKGIDIFMDTIDEEYEKILKSPHWVEKAKQKGNDVSKPTDVLAYLSQIKTDINATYGLENQTSKNL